MPFFLYVWTEKEQFKGSKELGLDLTEAPQSLTALQSGVPVVGRNVCCM